MEIRVHIAVMVVAPDPQRADTAAADVIAQKAAAGGHSVVARATIADALDPIGAKLDAWIADREIDVVIVAADPNAQHAGAALKPLVDEAVPGFTDLFRWLAFQEIGASAMMAAAEAARCGAGPTTTFVFVLPAVANAAAAAMDKLILPQLDARATGKTLVVQMPRLAARVAPPVLPPEPTTDKTEAVPTAVTGERTEAGPGLVPRLPAQNIVRKETPAQNIVRKEAPAPIPKPPPDERTRVISSSQLERKLQQSNQHEVATKPRIDIARLLPRVPPGADSDFDDNDTADITGVLSPQPFVGRSLTPKKLTPAPVPAVAKRDETGRAVRQTVRPVARRDEDGRVILPAKDPGSGAIGRAKLPSTQPSEPATTAKAPRPLIHDAKTPPIEVLPPALRPKFEDAKTQAHKPSFEAKTPVPQFEAKTPVPQFEAKTPVPQKAPSLDEAKAPKFVDAKTPPVAPQAPKPVEPIGRPKATPAAASPVVGKVVEPVKRVEESSAVIPLADVEVEEIVSQSIPIPITVAPPAPRAPTPPVPTTPPPLRTATTTPPPMPAVAAPVPAPPATMPPPLPPDPVPLPLLPKRAMPTGEALPLGDADFTSLKSNTGRRIAMFLLLAVLAAAGGIAFVRFVIQKPSGKPETGKPEVAQQAPAAAPIDAAAAAPAKPIDATAPVAEVPAAADAAVAVAPPPPPPSHGHADGAHGHHHDHGHAPSTPAGPVTAEVPPPPSPPKAMPQTAELPPPPPPPTEEGCDEMSCIETNYDKTCCERYKPHGDGFHPHADTLDKSAVRAGMGTVKPRVIACGESNTGVKGVVTVAVAVNSDGAVTSATVVDAPAPALGECVVAAVKKAQFAKTAGGGSFNYPFKFE